MDGACSPASRVRSRVAPSSSPWSGLRPWHRLQDRRLIPTNSSEAGGYSDDSSSSGVGDPESYVDDCEQIEEEHPDWPGNVEECK